jgi:hypothetical protein
MLSVAFAQYAFDAEKIGLKLRINSTGCSFWQGGFECPTNQATKKFRTKSYCV